MLHNNAERMRCKSKEENPQDVDTDAIDEFTI